MAHGACWVPASVPCTSEQLVNENISTLLSAARDPSREFKFERGTYRAVLSLIDEANARLNELTRHVCRAKLGAVARDTRL